jgi:D-alanine--poly(phosphoribitol) ligase subunit 1
LIHKFSNIPSPPIAYLVFENVLSIPNNTALVINKNEYSYYNLWQLVNRIYQLIPTDKTYNHIGIYCNDDVQTYASIIAVNLYGAAYVPLNNLFPAARNKNYAKQCNLELILSSTQNDDLKIIAENIHVINTSINEILMSEKTINFVDYRKTFQPISYILFTSGTTGNPKGVPVSHNNLFFFFNYFLKHYKFNSDDKFLQVYELSFDVSVFSFFMPLLTGGTCYILPIDGIKYLKIAEFLTKENITVVSMVPTVLRYLEPYMDEIKLPNLRYSFFSGDALLHHLAVKWNRVLPNGEIHNFYGPTETTIVCSRYIFHKKDSLQESKNNIVPIGKLFDGMDFLIVDEENKPSEKGELCLAGELVVSNYLNNENEDKFFRFNNQKYYKTGDIVSLNMFGNFVFYGRTDSQVKINGYRIELNEVEAAIQKTTNYNCVVICKTLPNNTNELVACIETDTLDIPSLSEKLMKILPEYMLPRQYFAVNQFPLNNNGKTDKNKLNQITHA